MLKVAILRDCVAFLFCANPKAEHRLRNKIDDSILFMFMYFFIAPKIVKTSEKILKAHKIHYSTRMNGALGSQGRYKKPINHIT
jgi:hypothetical protein